MHGALALALASLLPVSQPTNQPPLTGPQWLPGAEGVDCRLTGAYTLHALSGGQHAPRMYEVWMGAQEGVDGRG